MKLDFFENRRVRQIFTLVLLISSLACMFPPQHPAFQWWAAQTVAIAVSYIGLGLIFLMYNKFRLMFVCFGCSAVICFFKNETESANQIPTYWPPRKTESGFLFQFPQHPEFLIRDLEKDEFKQTPEQFSVCISRPD
jgi:hypothetical protein